MASSPTASFRARDPRNRVPRGGLRSGAGTPAPDGRRPARRSGPASPTRRRSSRRCTPGSHTRRRSLDQLLAVQRARTIDNTLRPYDDVLLEVDAVASQAQLVQSVHPDEAVRQAAERVSQKVGAFAAELSLNRGVFDALNGSTRRPRTRKRSTTCGGRCATSAWPAWTRTRRRGSGSRRCATSWCSSARSSTATSGRISGPSPPPDAAELDGLPRRLHQPAQAGRRAAPSRSPSTIPIRCPCSRSRRTRTCASGCTWNTTTAGTRRTWRCSTR